MRRVWIFLKRMAALLAVVLGLVFILNAGALLGGHFRSPDGTQPLSFALLFIAGTLTGFHCAGMCGALVVGYTVKSANAGGAGYLTHLYYGAGKTLSYTVMGGLFGALGSLVTFTPFMRGMAGVLAGGFLVLFGLSTLHFFKPLNRFGLKTPAFVKRWLGRAYRSKQGPFVIGLLNGLMIICGPLQAMYVMAAGTGDPLEGAAMLLSFGLGTLPLMMGFGMLASAFSRQLAPRLVKMSGVIVILLGVFMLQRGQIMLEGGPDPHAAMGQADMVHEGHGHPAATVSAVDTIRELIRKSEEAIEQLRRQLHP